MVVYRMIVEPDPEPRHRPAVWSLVRGLSYHVFLTFLTTFFPSQLAGLFFVNIAYVAVTGYYDNFAKISYFIGVGFLGIMQTVGIVCVLVTYIFLATLLAMCLITNYFGNHPFHRFHCFRYFL
jgi:hypothetical protein